MGLRLLAVIAAFVGLTLAGCSGDGGSENGGQTTEAERPESGSVETVPATTTTEAFGETIDFTDSDGVPFEVSARIVQDLTVDDPDQEVGSECPVGDLPEPGTRYVSVELGLSNESDRQTDGQPTVQIAAVSGELIDSRVVVGNIDGPTSEDVEVVDSVSIPSNRCLPSALDVSSLDPDSRLEAIGGLSNMEPSERVTLVLLLKANPGSLSDGDVISVEVIERNGPLGAPLTAEIPLTVGQ